MIEINEQRGVIFLERAVSLYSDNSMLIDLW